MQFITARTAPQAISTRRPSASRAANVRHGFRQTAKMSAAEAIRSQATPSTSTRAKSSTANAGPR